MSALTTRLAQIAGCAALAMLVAGGVADAARLDVELPTAGQVYVFDQGGPMDGSRISCPPDCTHSNPGPSVSISSLRVDVQPDPVTRDPGWDIVSLEGCGGTSTLPATSVICYVTAAGDVRVRVVLRYRPILSVTFTGTINVPLSGLNVTSSGAGPGFSCDGTSPQPHRCAQHYTPNETVHLTASTGGSHAQFLGMSAPCGGETTCDFTLVADTCITVTYTHVQPEGFPTATLDGPGCVTGDGGGGGGGSTSTVPASSTTTTTLPPGTDDLLDGLLDGIVNSLPLLIPKKIGPFSVPGRGTITASVTTSPATQLRATASGATGSGASVLVKAKRKVRRAGDTTVKLRFTKAGRRVFTQGTPVPVTVTVRFRTKAGKAERSRDVTIPLAPAG